MKMTFTNQWGTEYPESTRKFINPTRLSNIDRTVLDKAREITSRARTTDDAILAIHGFMKTIQSRKIPAVDNKPVMRASDVLEKVEKNPLDGMISRDKVLLEVALLRAIDIPARVAMYQCNARNPSIVTSRRVKSMFTIPRMEHFSTEVYATGKNGEQTFLTKDSWIPDSECSRFKRKCTINEFIEWDSNREIKGVLDAARCKKIMAQEGTPVVLNAKTIAGVTARKYSHVLDVIDPLGDDK